MKKQGLIISKKSVKTCDYELEVGETHSNCEDGEK